MADSIGKDCHCLNTVDRWYLVEALNDLLHRDETYVKDTRKLIDETRAGTTDFDPKFLKVLEETLKPWDLKIAEIR